MSDVMVAVLVVLVEGAFVAVAVIWFGVFCIYNMSRRPSELSVLPPKRQTFPNGYKVLHFYITYCSDSSIYPDKNAFTADAVYPRNFVQFSVPGNAKLTGIMLFYRDNDDPPAQSYTKTFWAQAFAFQLPDSVEGAQAISLRFSVPGDEWGISRHFRLV